MSAVATRDAVLSLENVSFQYPTGLVALDDVSVELRRGSSLGIVGPSGCGKSTLLRVIAGLNAPTAGEVRTAITPGKHAVSMLFQQDTLMPWRTVRKNVMLYADFHPKIDRRGFSERCTQLVSMVGLEDFEDAYPHQLSGGMRRRVGLLAALAPQPEILVLDEPFSSIDEPTRIAIHQELVRLVAANHASMIIATHDLSEAISLCDTVCILSARPGRIVDVLTTESIADRSDLLAVRKEPAYLELYARLWESLSAQIRRSRVEGTAGDG